MNGVLKSSRMGCRCSTVPNSRSTPQWCLPWDGTGPRTRSAPMWMVPRCWQPDAASNVDIQSWQGRTAGHGSWSWLARLAGGGLTRAGISCASCPERRPARSLRCCSSECVTPGCSGGGQCWLAVPLARSHCHCWKHVGAKA